MPDRTRARELATEFLKKGNPTGWFEALYQEAEAQSDTTEIPWADGVPNPDLLTFWRNHPLPSANKSALVVGSGLGDDAQQLAAWGFQTTAFDISESAIMTASALFIECLISLNFFCSSPSSSAVTTGVGSLMRGRISLEKRGFYA